MINSEIFTESKVTNIKRTNGELGREQSAKPALGVCRAKPEPNELSEDTISESQFTAMRHETAHHLHESQNTTKTDQIGLRHQSRLE